MTQKIRQDKKSVSVGIASCKAFLLLQRVVQQRGRIHSLIMYAYVCVPCCMQIISFIVYAFCLKSVAFREQLRNPLVSFNITETIVALEMVRSALPTLMTQIDNVITELMNVRDVQIPQLMSLTVSKGMQ